jgi:hypothetical protein
MQTYFVAAVMLVVAGCFTVAAIAAVMERKRTGRSPVSIANSIIGPGYRDGGRPDPGVSSGSESSPRAPNPHTSALPQERPEPGQYRTGGE